MKSNEGNNVQGQDKPQDQVAQVTEQLTVTTNVNAPASGIPAVNNTAQTGNVGTPLQVENVQYNMSVKPVESKVGLYMRVLSIAMWFTVIFACSFLSSLVSRIVGDDSSDLGSALVVTLSLLAVSTPIFVVAYRKFKNEERNNPAVIDDLFFKKSVRQNLWVGVVLGAIAAFSFIYTVLSGAFLEDNEADPAGIFSALIFTLGFGSIVWFYWKLHAQTKR